MGSQMSASRTEEARWLLLIHQIPPRPAYLRAKIGRRLQRVGAVAIKNAVYALPSRPQSREELQGVAREVAEGGGDATVCTATMVDGLSDEQVEALFRTAREKDYAEIAREARDAARKAGKAKAAKASVELRADLMRCRKRVAEITAIDFFGANGREGAESDLAVLERRLAPEVHPDVSARAKSSERARIDDYRGRVWVTRKNVHVDRIACAWLIRRFIDAKARLRFIEPDGFVAKPHEVTFDMRDAHFTHEGDRCSFETIVARFALREPGLSVIAEIIHDLDVNDGKFGRAEAPGVGALLAGIALRHPEDEDRIAVGGTMFDALLALYKRRRP